MENKLWLVKFIQKGFEPPLPFGKAKQCVFAANKIEALEKAKSICLVSDYKKPTVASILNPNEKQIKEAQSLDFWLGL